MIEIYAVTSTQNKRFPTFSCLEDDFFLSESIFHSKIDINRFNVTIITAYVFMFMSSHPKQLQFIRLHCSYGLLV